MERHSSLNFVWQGSCVQCSLREASFSPTSIMGSGAMSAWFWKSNSWKAFTKYSYLLIQLKLQIFLKNQLSRKLETPRPSSPWSCHLRKFWATCSEETLHTTCQETSCLGHLTPWSRVYLSCHPLHLVYEMLWGQNQIQAVGDDKTNHTQIAEAESWARSSCLATLGPLQ